MTEPEPKKVEIPNEVNGINTDDRKQYDWRSKYEGLAISEIRKDAACVGALLFLTLLAILLTWSGSTFSAIESTCVGCAKSTFNKYAYYYLGGQLGGALFSVKYLYKVVARGYWNIDRRLWRYLSPFLSGGLALVVGALLDSGVLGVTTKVQSSAAFLSYGFLTGYFADRAIDKMSEVAETIFGAPGRKDQTQVSKKP